MAALQLPTLSKSQKTVVIVVILLFVLGISGLLIWKFRPKGRKNGGGGGKKPTPPARKPPTPTDGDDLPPDNAEDKPQSIIDDLDQEFSADPSYLTNPKNGGVPPASVSDEAQVNDGAVDAASSSTFQTADVDFSTQAKSFANDRDPTTHGAYDGIAANDDNQDPARSGTHL